MLSDYRSFLQTKVASAPSYGLSDVQPEEVNPWLKPHQRDIVVWNCRGGRRANFASFGLGKTVIQLETCRILSQRLSMANGEGRMAKKARALIVIPLGVRQEFKRDAEQLGIRVQYVRNDADLAAFEASEAGSEALGLTAENAESAENFDGGEVDAGDYVKTEGSSAPRVRPVAHSDAGRGKVAAPVIFLTNYERIRDGHLSLEHFEIASLDEASVLRGYGTKTFQTFLTLFDAVPFRFVATATPSPNRFKELIHYAGFLGVMDTGQALTRFFKRDSTKAGNLQLHPHKEREFWLWMASWACFITKPSDLGYSDEGYELPPIRVHWHCLPGEYRPRTDRDGQMTMIADPAKDLQAAAEIKRLSIKPRVRKMLEILDAAPDRHFLLWHDLEAERQAIRAVVPGVLEVYGTLDLETREQRVIDFSEGRGQYLATKPVLSGSGCNFQRHCADAVFLGAGYKFNDFIQAVHRIYRFLQGRAVNIHVIFTGNEQAIVDVLKAKWVNHDKLQAEMTAIVKKYGLSKESMRNEMIRTIGVERQERRGRHYTAVNNDCVEETMQMDADSVDLICTSIPFGNHYEYSPSYNDFGHNEDNDRFFQQMDHLTPQLLRVLKPGRVYACHVKDRILFGNVTGSGCPTVDPFHMLTTLHTLGHGFLFLGMITIETDVVRENNQTYRLGYTEQCKDGSKMGVGCPEYLLLFRKPATDKSKAYADEKISKDKADYSLGRWQIDARAKWNSSGNRFLSPAELRELPLDVLGRMFTDYYGENVYDFGAHVAAAEALDGAGRLPKTFETLRIPARSRWVWHDVNRMQTLNGEQAAKNRMMHICPLQFDIVDRVIERWSQRGELVFDPFGGLMTTPYLAIKLGRKGYGVELNPDYWRDGLGYLERAEIDANSPTLFDLDAEEACKIAAGHMDAV